MTETADGGVAGWQTTGEGRGAGGRPVDGSQPETWPGTAPGHRLGRCHSPPSSKPPLPSRSVTLIYCIIQALALQLGYKLKDKRGLLNEYVYFPLLKVDISCF